MKALCRLLVEKDYKIIAIASDTFLLNWPKIIINIQWHCKNCFNLDEWCFKSIISCHLLEKDNFEMVYYVFHKFWLIDKPNRNNKKCLINHLLILSVWGGGGGGIRPPYPFFENSKRNQDNLFIFSDF